MAAGSLISLRVEKESHDEGPVVASLISPRVEKDVTRAPEENTLGRYRTCRTEGLDTAHNKLALGLL